jgi:LmbE family N-acetylglucosaminyl deacetylase
VVTLTAGDASDRYESLRQSPITLSRQSVARLRVWDSVTIPQYCGLSPEQVVNLCFPDGALREMFKQPDREFQGGNDEPEALAFSDLRRINRSSLTQPGSRCTWRSLVRDLGRIIEEVKPTIVVCPHPTLDPHSDHLFATVALCEALKGSNGKTERMFLYSVHNRRTELWPFGPVGSGVALLPIDASDGVCASGFYSHALSTGDQEQKFVALEAMHDVRQVEIPTTPSTGQLVRAMTAELRGWAHGLGREPKSYLRRAVRPDELFFVASLKEGMNLTDRALENALRPSTL